MMFYLMLPCYIIVSLAVVFTLNSAIDSKDGVLIGVTIPMKELAHPEITVIVERFKRRKRCLNLIMILIAMLGFFLRHLNIVSALYGFAWIIVYVIAMQLLLIRGFDELYTYKKSMGFLVGETVIDPNDGSLADSDIYWRGGIYHNPNDNKFWVEKRIGIGLAANMARKSAKILFGFVVAFVIGVFVYIATFLPFDFPSLSLQIKEDRIEIAASKYHEKIEISSIEQAGVIDKLPKIYKNEGSSINSYDFGTFRVIDYGQCKLFLNEKKSFFLILKCENGTYIINSDKENELQQCIDILKEQGINFLTKE